jgi:hypothetical protein
VESQLIETMADSHSDSFSRQRNVIAEGDMHMKQTPRMDWKGRRKGDERQKGD